MTDYTDPSTAGHRLSNAEREEAVSALDRAHADGRISAEELTERITAARSAITRGDLAPLFADLPVIAHTAQPAQPAEPGQSAGNPLLAPPAPFSGEAGSQQPYPPQGQQGFAPAPGYGQAPGYGGGPGQGYGGYPTGPREPVRGGTPGSWIVAVMPFIALALFFICGNFLPGGYAWSWIFFLAIPAAAIIVYGPNGRNRY